MKERPYKSYRMEDFISGKSNILFVTGYSASGKTTIAKQYAKKYNALYIEIDFMQSEKINFAFTDEYRVQNKDIYDFWIKFMTSNGYGKIYEEVRFLLTSKYRGMSEQERVLSLIQFAKKYKKRLIVEGIQCYVYPDIWNEVIGFPIIVMDIDRKKAYRSSIKRDRKYHGLNLSPIYYKETGNYYKRQVLLLESFIEKLNEEYRKENIDMSINLESYLINPMTGKEHNARKSLFVYDYSDDYALEGIFRDAKSPIGFDSKEKGTFTRLYRTGTDRGVPVPTDLAIIAIVDLLESDLVSGGFAKNGAKFVKDFVADIGQAYKFAIKNEEKMKQLVNEGRSEEINTLVTEYRRICNRMITINRTSGNTGSVFGGLPAKMPKSSISVIENELNKWLKIFEACAVKVGDVYSKSNNASYLKKNFSPGYKKDKAKGSMSAFFFEETYAYCKDLLIILTNAIPNLPRII